MAIDNYIYKNRKSLQLLSIIMAVIGGVISYLYYGTEPLETIGGFICGAAVAFFIIFLSLKKP